MKAGGRLLLHDRAVYRLLLARWSASYLLERSAIDPLHREERPTAGVQAQLVHGADASVLELSRICASSMKRATASAEVARSSRKTLTRSRRTTGSKPARITPMPPRASSPWTVYPGKDLAESVLSAMLRRGWTCPELLRTLESSCRFLGNGYRAPRALVATVKGLDLGGFHVVELSRPGLRRESELIANGYIPLDTGGPTARHRAA